MAIDLAHTFVTSDHHFCSYKLPAFMHVFTEEQEKELIDKWNSVVGKDDIVYYNGDFCDGTLMELCEYFKQLNGQIVLIRGNHDQFNDNIYRAIFKDVVDKIVLDDLDLTIHHVPMVNLQTKLEIYGHLHRGNSFLNKEILTTSFCSCVQNNDGFPVSLETVMQKLKSQICLEDC